jgi:hypothetical protein
LVKWDGTPRYSSSLPGLIMQAMIGDMCDGCYTNKHPNCMRKSTLPPYLWFMDTVLQKNVCPLGHKTQGCGSFLTALYAVHSDY